MCREEQNEKEVLMKRLLGILGAVGAISMMVWSGAGPASAGETARVRVVHASPDAPAVDVYADGARALTNVPYKGYSDYLPLPAGPHNFKVFATGADPASDTAVIDADATLEAGKDYTVVAVGLLADIEAAVFEDNNAAPAAGKAHVRVIHASPDAPAVDVAVAGGPVLFSNLAFPNAAGPSPVDAGTYDLEVRAAGTTTAALEVPGVQTQAGKIYTVLAVGLLEGEPALEALPIVNDPAPAVEAAPSPAPAPTSSAGTLPASGSGTAGGGDSAALYVGLLAAIAVVAGAGAVGLAFARAK
jgi:hypothetical protein